MADIHFRVSDELHQLIKVTAARRGESIKEAGERLFRWYVDGTDERLLRVCTALILWWTEDLGYQTDEGYYLSMDDLLELRFTVDDAKYALAEARQQQGGGEEE